MVTDSEAECSRLQAIAAEMMDFVCESAQCRGLMLG